MLRRCSFQITIRITNRAMRIFRAKRNSFAQDMLKPERKSPSIPTVEIVSPLGICAVHEEIIFDPLMLTLYLRLPNINIYFRKRYRAIIPKFTIGLP
jgi:hypothetical protein